VLVHRNLPTEPDRFLNAIALYRRQDLGRAVYSFLNSRVSLTF
jgi:hypothetical protein